MKSHFLFLIVFVVFLSGCSSENVDETSVVSSGTLHRAITTFDNLSETNPELFSNWEHCNTIALSSVSSNGFPKQITSPWADGTISSLPEEFRSDIKKEDGWTMIFHTFKKLNLDERQNYICFYNIFTGFIKIFYYYEGENPSQNLQWYVKTTDGSNSDLFNLSEYVAIPNQDPSKRSNTIICSNLSSNPAAGLTPGWNGFEFEVPYIPDLEHVSFIIGAYNDNVINYSFSGKEESESAGTITTTHAGSKGLLGSVASLMGKGAQSFVSKVVPKVIKNQKISEMISSIPAGSYGSLISSGLGLLFGKSTTVENSQLKFTTSGTIELDGVGTFLTTASVPPITFNLFNAINQNTSIRQLGVWNAYPKVTYPRYTTLESKSVRGRISDGRYVVEVSTKTPQMYSPFLDVKTNPNLDKYLKKCDCSVRLVRCDSLYGKPYKVGMIDISDFTWKKKGQLYKDNFISLYENNQSSMHYDECYVDAKKMSRTLYYDWGYIDCGRMLATVTINLTYSYNGKDINVVQSRTYEPYYDIDEAHVGSEEETGYTAVNYGRPFFDEKKVQNHLPLIDWYTIKN